MFFCNTFPRFVHRVEQIDGGFFERYGSGLKENFEEDTIIAEKDKYATLNAREISEVYQDTADRTQLSFNELLSSLLELNVSVYIFYLFLFYVSTEMLSIKFVYKRLYITESKI